MCFFPQYLQNKWMNFDKILLCIDVYKIHVVSNARNFGHFLTVIAFDRRQNLFMLNILWINLWISIKVFEWCRNFVYAQYLVDQLMDFGKILQMHWNWKKCRKGQLQIIFRYFSTDGFWYNFVYALIYMYMIHVVTNTHYFPERFNRVMSLDWF